MYSTFVISVIFVIVSVLFLVWAFRGFITFLNFLFSPSLWINNNPPKMKLWKKPKASKKSETKSKSESKPVFEAAGMMKDIYPKRSRARNSKTTDVQQTEPAFETIVVSRYEGNDYSKFDSPTCQDVGRMDRIQEAKAYNLARLNSNPDISDDLPVDDGFDAEEFSDLQPTA